MKMQCSKCGSDITRSIKYRYYKFSCICGWNNTLIRKNAQCPTCQRHLSGTTISGFLCSNCADREIPTVDQIAKVAIAKAYTKDKLDVEEIDDIIISTEYLAIKRLLELDISPILVMGKAGTGKSTLIRLIRNFFKMKNVVVVAPTGVAALNAKGSTINSFFGFPPRIIQPDDISVLPSRKLYRHLDILVIDEISMVRSDLLDAIHLFLSKNGKKPGSLFGGVQIVLLGDIFQLPPVVGSKEERVLNTMGYASAFFFSAKCLNGIKLLPVELTQVYRQTDSDFVKFLDQLRLDYNSKEVSAHFNRLCYGRTACTGAVVLATTNALVDAKNISELAKISLQERVFMGRVTGTFEGDDARLPSPMRLSLKIGAQVMFTRNDERKRWINGTVGRVLSFNESVIRVELLTDHPGNVCEVSEETWKKYSYRLNSSTSSISTEETGQYTQYPLMLAWAVTIHKAQGKTLEAVHVDFGHGTFASGQAYVALSRCKLLQGLTLERPIREDDISCSLVLKEFNDQMQSQIPDIEDLSSQTTKRPDILGLYPVVGLQYCASRVKTCTPPPFSVVNLVVEPNNTYDSRAVRVDWNGSKLGYIPRDKNQDLSKHLNDGLKTSAIIQSIQVSESGELLAITIKVY